MNKRETVEHLICDIETVLVRMTSLKKSSHAVGLVNGYHLETRIEDIVGDLRDLVRHARQVLKDIDNGKEDYTYE